MKKYIKYISILSLFLIRNTQSATLDVTGWFQEDIAGLNKKVKIIGVAADEVPFFTSTPGNVVSRKIVTTDISDASTIGKQILTAPNQAAVQSIIGSVSSGGGDVVGPNSSVNSRIAIFNGTTGKSIADGGQTISGILNRANHIGTQTLSTISDAGALAALNTVTTTQIADGTLLNADINANAGIALSKLAVDPLQRGNHTGTQSLSTISNAGALAALSSVGSNEIQNNSVGPNQLASTNVTPGIYTNANISVDSDGRIVQAANGSAGSGSSSLTSTYVGYGDGTNALTGEAGFTYDAANDTLFVDKIRMGSGLLSKTANLDTISLSGSTGGENIVFNFASSNIVSLSSSSGVALFDFGSIDAKVPYEIYDSTGWNGDLTVPTKDAIRDKLESVTGTGNFVLATSPTIAAPTISGAITLPDNVEQVFNPGAANAGLNVGSISGDPSAPNNGAIWYDSTANELTARINGTNVALGAGGGGGTGNVTKVGTPVDNQIGVWTGDGTLEGDTAFTFDTSTDTLTVPNMTVTTLNTTTLNSNSFQFEGSVVDANDTILTVVNPTAIRTITLPNATGTVALAELANNWATGIKQTFNPSSTTAGINVGAVSGDPSTPINGDLWYDSSSNELTARINGINVALGAGGGGGTSVNTDTIWDAKGDLAVGTGSNTASKLTVGNSNGQVLTVDSTTATGLKWATPATATGTFGITIDGGGTVITSGIKGDVSIPYACTIDSITILADQAGSIVIDLWKDTYNNYPPTDADSITASAPVTIISTEKGTDSTLTGWATSVSAGDTIRFNVDSASSITRATLVVKVTKL